MAIGLLKITCNQVSAPCHLASFLPKNTAIYDPKGLDVDCVVAHRREGGSIMDCPAAEKIPESSKALELDCDILVPAALENQITAENAPRVQAKIIAEAANGPTTAEADAVLREKGAVVLPDTFLNAGGVTVSYFEWVKNLSHVRFGRMQKRFEQGAYRRLLQAVERVTDKQFTDAEMNEFTRGATEEDLVNSGLEETMVLAFAQILAVRDHHQGKIDLRTAALISAIDKIAASYEHMGIFP